MYYILLRNKSDGLVKAKAIVKTVFNSEKLTKEKSTKLVEEHQNKLHLNSDLKKRFAGKRIYSFNRNTRL